MEHETPPISPESTEWSFNPQSMNPSLLKAPVATSTPITKSPNKFIAQFPALFILICVTTSLIYASIKIGPMLTLTRAQAKTGYWIPNDNTEFEAEFDARIKDCNQILIQTWIFGDKTLARKIVEAREKGTQVYVIVDGTIPNRQLNIQNKNFFNHHGITYMVDPTTKPNLHTIIIDQQSGWISTGTFNTKFSESQGKIFRLDNEEAHNLAIQFLARAKRCQEIKADSN